MSKAMISTTGLSTNVNKHKVFLKLKCGQHQTATKKTKKRKKILIHLYGYMLVATV